MASSRSNWIEPSWIAPSSVEGCSSFGLLVEAGFSERVARARAEDAVIRIQGALVLSGGLGDQGTFRRAIKRIGTDLLAN